MKNSCQDLVFILKVRSLFHWELISVLQLYQINNINKFSIHTGQRESSILMCFHFAFSFQEQQIYRQTVYFILLVVLYFNAMKFVFCFIVLHFIILGRFCGFYKLKICGNFLWNSLLVTFFQQQLLSSCFCVTFC